MPGTPPPIAALRSQAEGLAVGLAGLRLVVLFGSVARGQPLGDSDLDVGILGASHWDALALGSKLGAVAGREAQVVELEHASDLLRFHVARDGVPLFQAAPDVWPRFQAEAAVRYFDLAPIIALCAEGARQRLLREAAGG